MNSINPIRHIPADKDNKFCNNNYKKIDKEDNDIIFLKNLILEMHDTHQMNFKQISNQIGLNEEYVKMIYEKELI